MPKLSLVLIMSSLLVSTFFVFQAETQANSHLGWKKSVSKFRFYIKAIIGGNKRTEYIVAKSNITNIRPSMFGAVYVIDAPITPGPEIKSREIGRLQGVVALSDFDEKSLTNLLNVMFTRGKYNGSTLSIVGRIPLMDKETEVPIVGGTGCFRMASGYIISRNYSTDEARMLQVTEYNAVVYS